MALWTVTTTADRVDGGDGVLSLREALSSARVSAGHDRITFDSEVFTAGSSTIRLVQGALAIAGGDRLRIDGDLDDDGRADVTIDGGDVSQVLRIDGGTVRLDGLVVAHGYTGGERGGSNGGGIAIVGGDVTILHSVVRDCSTYDANGGGLAVADARLRLHAVDFENNLADVGYGNLASARGGAILATDTSLIIEAGRFVANRADSSYAASGGAIAIMGGDLTISDSRFSANDADAGGGEAFSSAHGAAVDAVAGRLTISRSHFVGNHAESSEANAFGGAVSARAGSSLAVADSSFVRNSARGAGNYYSGRGAGGALFVEGTAADLTGSSFVENRTAGGDGGFGAGIYIADAVLDLANATVVGNLAMGRGGFGGGLAIGDGGVAHLTHATIVDNHADRLGSAGPAIGGGVAVLGSGMLTLANSILAGNTAVDGGGDVAGRVLSDGANLFSQAGIAGAEPGDLLVDPASLLTDILRPLADRGGPTPVLAPRGGSIVLDAGANASSVGADGAPLRVDQTGAARLQGDRVDLGAVEGGPRPPPGGPDPAGPDRLFGRDGADLFVLDGGRHAVIAHFDPEEGDRVSVVAAALLDPDGGLERRRLAAADAGSALLLRADLDGDGSFETLIARLVGSAGLGLDAVLQDAVA